MILVITEKPSVAMVISRVLGARERRDGYFEGNGYLVSWCIGHLVELAPPESYDKKYGTWRQEDLPILTVEWKYEVIPETKKQFQVLAKLMNSVGESEQDKNEKSTLSQDNRFLVPDTEAKKKDLFAKVRSGQIRILMGSTQKMGAGTNVQDRLYAVHHLDVGWRPADMTQRNGRIIRQGNTNPEVKVVYLFCINIDAHFSYIALTQHRQRLGSVGELK